MLADVIYGRQRCGGAAVSRTSVAVPSCSAEGGRPVCIVLCAIGYESDSPTYTVKVDLNIGLMWQSPMRC